MDLQSSQALASTAVVAALPLMLAGTGELVAEKSGVLNLGVEGMMLLGAVTGYAVAAATGNPWVGLAVSVLAGLLAALVFALLTITMLANQVATGLALTIFGTGLSAYLGRSHTSATLSQTIAPWPVPWLSDLPVLGPSLFSQTPVGYMAFALAAGVAWLLYRSRAGLVLRAVGESPEVARAIGRNVANVRYAATLFGGGMAGLAGGYYAIVYLRLWQEQLTAGQGWVALALVVFAGWRPGRLVLGALLFGGVTALQFHAQTVAVAIPAPLLAMLPYLATVAVLVAISRHPRTIRLHSPQSLGQPMTPTD
jgi:general nucleoside transport system permease protein